MYNCSTTFTSQPRQYFAIFILFQFGVIVYFVFTLSSMNLGMVLATLIAYAICTAVHIVFPFIDPGIIPKILPDFDD